VHRGEGGDGERRMGRRLEDGVAEKDA
jgi:hypothetical protein